MPNGRPGDHPLTDILTHKLEVYGWEADELIRKISALCSGHELDDWWEREIANLDDREMVLAKAQARLDELTRSGRGSGEKQ